MPEVLYRGSGRMESPILALRPGAATDGLSSIVISTLITTPEK